MKNILIIAILFLSGCSIFDTYEYPASAYGGMVNKIAYETKGESCVDHSIKVADKLWKAGIGYEFIILAGKPGLNEVPGHTIVKVGDLAIDTNTREPYPYSDYVGMYEKEINLGNIQPDKIPEVLNSHGYVWK